MHVDSLPKVQILSGITFLVTRPDSPDTSLTKRLQANGASVLNVPMIEIKPPSSWNAFDQTVNKSIEFEWAVFTSRNGVNYCFQRLKQLGCDANKVFATTKIACVGKSTTATLEKYGLQTDLVPKHFQSEGLISSFSAFDLQEKTIWMIQAESPRETLRIELEKLGAKITFTPVYQNSPPIDFPPNLLEQLQQNQLDWIVFASASAVHHFHHLLPVGIWDQLQPTPKIACLGEITATAVLSYQWQVSAQPQIQDFKHLVEAIKNFMLNS